MCQDSGRQVQRGEGGFTVCLSDTFIIYCIYTGQHHSSVNGVIFSVEPL